MNISCEYILSVKLSLFLKYLFSLTTVPLNTDTEILETTVTYKTLLSFSHLELVANLGIYLSAISLLMSYAKIRRLFTRKYKNSCICSWLNRKSCALVQCLYRKSCDCFRLSIENRALCSRFCRLFLIFFASVLDFYGKSFVFQIFYCTFQVFYRKPCVSFFLCIFVH